ncbi:hypothetical protein FRC08_001063 [Ceratobasidium sp. 394]|nr:hypothetical protein FRC08_001063 [Ceratobasidium sp. 394]
MPRLPTKLDVAKSLRQESQLWHEFQPERCGKFRRAWMYVKSLDQSVDLGYIPRIERWGCKWHDATTLICPKRGYLRWCSPGPRLESAWAMQKVHLYIVRGHVGPSIQHLVRHTAEAPNPTVKYRAEGFWIHGTTLSQWMDEAIQKWQEQVPSMYWGPIRDISRQEMFNLVVAKGVTMDQFHEWLDQRAWDAAQIQLDADMAALSLGPATNLLEQVHALEQPKEERGW